MPLRTALLALLTASLAFAQDAPGAIDRPAQLPGLTVSDVKAAWTAPAGWSGATWTRVGLGAAAVVGLSLALDRTVARGVQRSDLSRFDSVAKGLGTLGGTGSIAIAGGAYLGGLMTDQPRVREFGADAACAMLVGEVAFTLPAKYLAGRSRPSTGTDPYRFQPMRGDPGFPSSHATLAFSLATVIAQYADRPWASVAAYGGAGLVGLSRIQQREHFVSDLVAGAAVGIGSARLVLLRHRTLRLGTGRPVDLAFTPVWTGDQTGLRARLTF